jgi:hypothetical protein
MCWALARITPSIPTVPDGYRELEVDGGTALEIAAVPKLQVLRFRGLA